MKILLSLLVMMFGLSGHLVAMPIDFVQISLALNMSPTTSGVWSFMGSGADLNAALAPGPASQSFAMAGDEGYSSSFFDLKVDLPEYFFIAGEDFAAEATLAFLNSESVDGAGGSAGAWKALAEFASGGWATWTDLTSMSTLMDGNELSVDFGDGMALFDDSGASLETTVANFEGSPSPEFSPLILLGAGLVGLVVCRNPLNK
jgi:hypothetical protein